MVTINQEQTYLGGNQTKSFLISLSQYSGMLLGALLWWFAFHPRRCASPPFRFSWRVLLLGLPIALSDISDTLFTTYGYHVGSGLFIVLFSFVTVSTALIRKFFLGRSIERRNKES